MNKHVSNRASTEAIRFEEKSIQCVKLSKHILPGADESLLEDQAVDFMALPDKAIADTLQRISRNNSRNFLKKSKSKFKNRYQILKENLNVSSPSKQNR
jgi:hypothetical protein